MQEPQSNSSKQRRHLTACIHTGPRRALPSCQCHSLPVAHCDPSQTLQGLQRPPGPSPVRILEPLTVRHGVLRAGRRSLVHGASDGPRRRLHGWPVMGASVLGSASGLSGASWSAGARPAPGSACGPSGLDLQGPRRPCRTSRASTAALRRPCRTSRTSRGARAPSLVDQAASSSSSRPPHPRGLEARRGASRDPGARKGVDTPGRSGASGVVWDGPREPR